MDTTSRQHEPADDAPDDDDLRPGELAERAAAIARRAGRLLIDHLPFGRYRGRVESKGARDLVSEVDRASEELILREIAESYPDHAVVGEEGGARLAPLDRARYRWIVDPLDGTTNFLHGHPFFAVSIGVQRLRGRGAPEMVAGAVFAPCFGELFVAARGLGAFMNTPAVPLRVSDTARLDEALVATGFPYDRERWKNDRRFLEVTATTQGVRRCGAAALDLAYVAAGRYDGFWELGLAPHDVAAGALLVEEAGGKVGGFAGCDDWLEGGHVLAATPLLFAPLQALVDRE